MNDCADVCLIVEGGYPYVLGGLASWTDGLIRSLPNLTFTIAAITLSSQEHNPKYSPPDNLIGLVDVFLDKSVKTPFLKSHLDDDFVDMFCKTLKAVISDDDGDEFCSLMKKFRNSHLGADELLGSRQAWSGMKSANQEFLKSAPFLEFFWTWRFLGMSVIAIASAPIPNARIYHAVSTGYAGLLGARFKCLTGRPLIITEHGIYTNERRIEIAISEWIYESRASGFSCVDRKQQLRDIWLDAFENFSRISYNLADTITAQFRANQLLQIAEGAPENKLHIIPNGIEIESYRSICPNSNPFSPCIILIGRVVPIKDIRTFILAMSKLRQRIGNIQAIVIGPEDEDPVYAKECRDLIKEHKLEDVFCFAGRVPDIKAYFENADVFALTSLSEAQPLALLEAGASGLPAVVTDVGSCREIIEGYHDGDNELGGFVVRTGDYHAIAEAIERILANPILKQKMGAALRRRIAKHYDSKNSAQMYSDLYARVSYYHTNGMNRDTTKWPELASHSRD